MSSITPEDFVKSLTECCAEFTEEITEKVEEGIKAIGEEAAEEVRALSPVDKGAYRRSWKTRFEKVRGSMTVTVYAGGRHYRLTHLLEKGHLNRDGTTRARAIPHISTAQEHAEKKTDKLLEGL